MKGLKISSFFFVTVVLLVIAGLLFCSISIN
jgi:hypothetical protein